MMLRKATRILLRETRLPLAQWVVRRRLTTFPEPERGAVAILRPDLIGDFVLATPALVALRRAFENKRVTLFGHPLWIPLAEWLQRWRIVEGEENGQFADAFAPLTEDDLVKPAAMLDGVMRLAPYETIVYFAASRTTNIDTLLSLTPGHKIAWQGGYGNMPVSRERANRRIYDTLYDVPGDAAEYMRNARMAAALDSKSAIPETPPRWRIPPEAIEETLTGFEPGLDKPFVAISPFTSVSLKNWPLDRYEKLVRRLEEAFPDHQFLLLGDKANSPLNALAQRSPRVTDLCGKTTLPQACCLIARAELSISGDTAAAHIASAVGTPALVVMGGGHYGRFFPYPAAHEECENVALTHEMPCFQCNWVCRYRWFRETPTPCVANVSVDSVFDAAVRLLQSRGR
ncbi:MAG: glycosyltransferase family 9 protein [Candidatus Hydrogenedentes bacterium]|nr:glycosyltransferase family 9 protein [Candidatus Hydrogenedentota bacterium]